MVKESNPTLFVEFFWFQVAVESARRVNNTTVNEFKIRITIADGTIRVRSNAKWLKVEPSLGYFQPRALAASHAGVWRPVTPTPFFPVKQVRVTATRLRSRSAFHFHHAARLQQQCKGEKIAKRYASPFTRAAKQQRAAIHNNGQQQHNNGH